QVPAANETTGGEVAFDYRLHASTAYVIDGEFDSLCMAHAPRELHAPTRGIRSRREGQRFAGRGMTVGDRGRAGESHGRPRAAELEVAIAEIRRRERIAACADMIEIRGIELEGRRAVGDQPGSRVDVRAQDVEEEVVILLQGRGELDRFHVEEPVRSDTEL